METVQEYEIIIRLTKENGRYGAAAETVSGGLLESVPPLSAAENDALYALLHALALKKLFRLPEKSGTAGTGKKEY